MGRLLVGILVLERHCILIQFLQFLALLVIPVILVIRRSVISWLWRLWRRLWRKPTDNCLSLPAGAATDLCRSRQQLLLENALLRQQLIVLRRQANRPQLTNADRT